jgi:hypothetical protein
MRSSLLDLKTNLKSLKYDSGNKPFVTKDINDPPSKSRAILEVSRRIDDVSRVAQAILPINSRFLENQAKLENINLTRSIDSIKVAQGKTTAGAVIQQVKNTAVTVAKVAASTLAQTAVAGTGVHFVRGFESATKKTYAGQALANGKVSLPQPITKLTGEDNSSENNKFNVSESYSRGDVSGDTKTKTALIVENLGTILIPENEVLLKSRPSTLASQINYQNTARSTFEVDENTGKPIVDNPLELKIRDFRQGKSDVISFDYSARTINKELRVGLGNKGYWKKPVDYTQTRVEARDRLNFKDVSTAQLDGIGVGESSVRDLVKFRFEVLSPGKTPVFLYFRALLSSLTDNYTGTWGETKYIGRGDKVRTYESFDRAITLGFKIVATTRDEMKPLYRKMVYLASTTAPTYDSSGTFMKGTIVKLTVGSYIYETPGTINSANFEWKENYPWEIAMQNPEVATDDDMQELPHMLDCTINFTPIHNFVPQTGLYHYMTSPTLESGAKPFF